MRYNEIIEGDSDRDLFGATPDSPARQELKKISIEELKQRRRELLAYVRTIARRHFNAATKVSGSKSFGTVTMLFGKEDQYSPNTQRLVAGVKAYLDDAGLQNKITDAGWLSVKVPDEVPTDLSEDIDDEELFGKSRNQIIAQGLSAEAAKEREIADEERGIGDLQNSHDFAVQAAETEELARAFAVSLQAGMQAWRSIKSRFRRNDFANIVEDYTGIDLHEIDKTLGEDVDDEELFGIDNDTRKTLRTLIRLRRNIEQDPHAEGIRNLLKNYNNSNSTLKQRADLTFEYMASTLGMTKEQFEAATPDLMFPHTFEYHRPWQLWDLTLIDKIIDFFKKAAERQEQGMNEETIEGKYSMRYQEIILENDQSDDELFGETSNIFMLVAPDSEILGQLPASAENHKRLLKRAREEAPNYIEAGYGIYDEMEIVLVNNGNFDGQKKIQVFTLSELMNIAESGEPNDDDLFGSEPALSGAKRLIYNAGRKILHSLEQAWQNPAIQREYKEYQEVGDTDAQFDQVVRIVKLPFKQVFVVDTIIREFAGAEGLNDFGWMIESGEFNDLVDAWQRFRDDPDIEHEDWFQRDARDFTGGLK